MKESLQPELSGTRNIITEAEFLAALDAAVPLLARFRAGLPEYQEHLGWFDLSRSSPEQLARMEELAATLAKTADTLVVIGVGGSNQAARAVVEALGARQGMRLVWAGNSLSAHEINRVLAELEGREFCINVIAKNFETVEPGIAFRVLRRALRERCGEDYGKRIVCTGTEGSRLEALATENGWHFLPFPQDIGGRFSALTPVGLFPLAAAGFDLAALAKGASDMRAHLLEATAKENPALRYAVTRKLLYDKGFRMEMLSFFEPRLVRFSKWWMQLFGESEGKEEKGLYPVCGNFSEDLHSVGQFLQDGSRVMFETFLDVADSGASCLLTPDGIEDGFAYLDGTDFDSVNRAAFEATYAAHAAVLPCLRLSLPCLNEEAFGSLFYFFFAACTFSALLLNVNPFDQPGVEAYKERMFKKLGK
ncbi:MAG: glucose-6-phosphate isomerase [Lachnospiraceae bacterium]|nr:glucose-6-phosphate isomerase [Lachnospiraceae bacterium]